ncbi:MAG: pantetheine-phosphate adenylyltransferase [Bacillota bacterium]
MAINTAARRVAVFPGQFDPVTLGHIDIIRRAVRLFDEVIVAVGINPEKRELFSHDQRLAIIEEVLRDIPGARAAKYEGLTVDFVRSVNAAVILRGIRDISDLHHEFQLALANRAVGGVETVFVMTGEQYALTSSSLIRQVVSLGGDLRKLSTLVPPNVISRLEQMQRRGVNLRTTGYDAPAT